MDYGYTHIQFRSVDAAGNPCSSDYYDQYNYYVYPSSGTSPADGGYISGDIAWPRSKTATYYKAYLGTSTLRMDEIVISSGKITIPRYNPFVDAAELSLLVYTTYYWYWEAYDGTGRLVRSPSKGAYSFRTSKF